MAFNIKNFKSNIDSYGYLKPSHFEVGVQSPNFMLGSSLINNGSSVSISNINDMMRFRIDQVKLPGISLMSNETRIYGVGTFQKMPYNAFLHDTTFTVLLDKKGDLWSFWYNWVRYIFESNGTESSSSLITSGGRVPSYTTKYKDDYSSTMQIIVYDQEGGVSSRVNLYEAFPSSVREVPLAWNDTQDLIRISISITYSHYSLENSALRSNAETEQIITEPYIPPEIVVGQPS